MSFVLGNKRDLIIFRENPIDSVCRLDCAKYLNHCTNLETFPLINLFLTNKASEVYSMMSVMFDPEI